MFTRFNDALGKELDHLDRQGLCKRCDQQVGCHAVRSLLRENMPIDTLISRMAATFYRRDIKHYSECSSAGCKTLFEKVGRADSASRADYIDSIFDRQYDERGCNGNCKNKELCDNARKILHICDRKTVLDIEDNLSNICDRQ